MEKILMYITNHYIIFIIAAVVLIISAVGFIVDEKKQEIGKSKDVADSSNQPKKETKKSEKNKK